MYLPKGKLVRCKSVLSKVCASSNNVLKVDASLLAIRLSIPRTFQIRTLQDVKDMNQVQYSKSKTWESRRYYLRKDGLGFSFHHTVLYKGNIRWLFRVGDAS